jgi:hypothetical protein
MTRILSLSMIVLIRWAIVSTVQPGRNLANRTLDPCPSHSRLTTWLRRVKDTTLPQRARPRTSICTSTQVLAILSNGRVQLAGHLLDCFNLIPHLSRAAQICQIFLKGSTLLTVPERQVLRNDAKFRTRSDTNSKRVDAVD